MTRPLPQASRSDNSGRQILAAAALVLDQLRTGKPVTTDLLRFAMTDAFAGTDAEGHWNWKLGYEACEAALVLFLRQYGPALHRNSRAPADLLSRIDRIARRMPSHTRRSEEMVDLQQFSTPLPLALAVATAADISPRDIVLEPSAGTGLLAIFAEVAGASLILNELSELRSTLLADLFPGVPVTSFDGAHIDDFLDRSCTPSIVLMNPPFSAQAGRERTSTTATGRHLLSALKRLAPGGRLVAITGANFQPDTHMHRQTFDDICAIGTIRLRATIDGRIYARHGTTFATQILVIDKCAAAEPIPASAGHADDVETLLNWISTLPPRAEASIPKPAASSTPHILTFPTTARRSPRTPSSFLGTSSLEGTPLGYDIIEAPTQGTASDGLYEPFRLTTISIPGAAAHSSKLVQSTAMASVLPPKPSYKPVLPPSLVEKGILSDAQLETIILAGEAHTHHLDRRWIFDGEKNDLTEAREDQADAIRFRRGFMLGDGTGAGKGRQAAGIILDNWLQGRRKAVWISISDKLIEDAQRDVKALGLEPLLVFPLGRFRPGSSVTIAEGILFTTYATLRNEARLKQITDWLGGDFDGALIIDEAHALANAAGGTGDRGDVAPSLQGRAGLKLQRSLPDARVLYVSATGATTVENLAYAERLGLWTSSDFPFASRAQFLETMDAGGVAAMEVLARDLRSLGLYTSRLLSYEGVEYDFLEHELTAAQIDCYDSYANAFRIIHQNLARALEATNVTGPEGTYNRNAKSAAHSAFESLKQRLFRSLLTSMATSSLIRAMEKDLEDGFSPVVQIVSTGAAMTERRLSEIPPSEWHDLQIDVSPREGVISYLTHSFPTQLQQVSEDSEGNITSFPIIIDGNPVTSREAEQLRDQLIEDIAALAPLPTALDQIVQHFGTDVVAEVTGRQRRIIRKDGKLRIENRPGSANSSEVDLFQSDRKKILVFSGAGGTGRSYHADLNAINQRRRHHYLLEPGWRADAAIQGLGRTNRTNQKQPPLFRPVATNVKAEKRFLSTIARRLDTLGAITRGQRQTGGQGMFRPEDNLESSYARDALRQFYKLVYSGRIDDLSFETFTTWTGLRIADDNGLKDDLPPINTFLNRLLALPIALQNTAFAAFESLVESRVEAAVAAGTYDIGIETLNAESTRIVDRHTIYSHPTSGAETELITLVQLVPTQFPSHEALEDSRNFHDRPDFPARYMRNERSGNVALVHLTSSMFSDDGISIRRVRIIRPLSAHAMPLDEFSNSHWSPISNREFRTLWNAEVAEIPTHSERVVQMVCGLLLPIWDRLPSEMSLIYRARTDDGQRLIGRKVSPDWAARHSGRQETFAVADVIDRLSADSHVFTLQQDLELRAATVMHVRRFELTGWTKPMRDRLRAIGLFSEIIAFQLRFFVPTDSTTVMEKLLDVFPVVSSRPKS